MRLWSRITKLGASFTVSILWLTLFWVSAISVAIMSWFTGFLGVLVTIAVGGFWLLIALGIIVFGMWSGWRNRHNYKVALRAIISPFLAVIFGIAGVFPIMWATISVLIWISFFMHVDMYQETIKKFENGEIQTDASRYNQNSSWQEYNAGIVVIDYGPPVRYAFLQQDRFLDNWGAIVYDPSGEIDIKTKKLRKLFGGDMVSCWPLGKSFYYCGFT